MKPVLIIIALATTAVFGLIFANLVGNLIKHLPRTTRRMVWICILLALLLVVNLIAIAYVLQSKSEVLPVQMSQNSQIQLGQAHLAGFSIDALQQDCGPGKENCPEKGYSPIGLFFSALLLVVILGLGFYRVGGKN